MKINELLVESQQLDELSPADIGRGVGKVAKGIGAVAGGVAGIPGAVKKGFQAGKQTVAGDEPTDSSEVEKKKSSLMGKLGQAVGAFKTGYKQVRTATTPADNKATDKKSAATTQPASQPSAEPAAQPAAQAKPVAGGAKPAPQAVAAAKSPTAYKQAQDAVSKLDKRGKQNLLKLLQKEFPQTAPAAAPAPAAKTAPAAPTAQPAQEPAVQQAAPAAKQPAAAPAKSEPAASEPQNAKFPGLEPNIDPERANAANARVGLPPIYTQNPDGTWRETDWAKGTRPSKNKAKKAAAPSQAEIDADRERLMGPTSDSIIRTGNSLAEALQDRIQQHKKLLVAEGLKKGEISIYKK